MQEVDYCGHATVATYHELFNLPENVSKTSLTQETRAGVFVIEKQGDGMIMMTQNNPVFGPIEEDRLLVAGLLGIADTDINSNLLIQVVTTNVSKLMVPIANVEALKKITPRLDAIADYTNSHDGKGLYCFTKSGVESYDLVARFFNPAVGINEDPATGVAAGPLGCYADKYIYQGEKKQIRINQGMWMGKSSDIFVDLVDGVKVGGYAVRFGDKTYD
jgi:PhzF family phenazine biosynthesis protein